MSVLVLSSAAGCKQQLMENHLQTVRDGLHAVPHVQEITKVFSNSPMDHFITHFGLDKKEPVTWNTEVFFGGRYVFTYQIDVLVDYKKNKIARIEGPPKFYLNQVTNIHRWSQSMGKGYRFGKAEWEMIVRANGDFSVAGIQLTTNNPVQGFEEFVRGWRAPRQRIE